MNVNKSVEKEVTSQKIVDAKTLNICIVLRYGQRVEYLLLDSEFKLIGKVVPKGLSGTVHIHDWASVWGGYMGKEKKFHLIYAVRDGTYEKGKKMFFKHETIDFEKGTVSNKPYFQLDAGESIIQLVPTPDKHYTLLSNSKTDVITLISPKDDGTVERKNIPFGLKSFYNEKDVDLNSYFYYSNFFGHAEETDIKIASKLTKVYNYGNKILIISTNLKEPPHIIEINLDNFQLNKRKLKMDGFCQNFTSLNSHIFDGKLYVINVCKEQIEIGVFDPFTDRLLKKILISETSPIEFNEAPSRTRGIVGGRSKDDEIKLKELIKILTKRSIGLAITINENQQIVLEGGSYDEAKKVYNYTTATTDTYVFYKANLSTNFKIVLDPITLEHVKGASVKSNFDYQNVIIENTPNWIAKNHFIIKKKGYLGYYNPSTQAFEIEELPVLR